MYDESYRLMQENWRKIIEFGPRPLGSNALRECCDYIGRQMEPLIAGSHIERFKTDAFTVNGWELEIVAPAPRKLKSYLFLGSGGGSFEGKVKYAGKNRIWNMYAWDRFAVVDSHDDITAYVSVREGGQAIPQTLEEGNTPLPHLIVGEEELETFRSAEKTGLTLKGFADVETKENASGYNIVVPVHKAEKRVILCGHYDTVYSTPGAYDNSAGAAVLMEVARRLKGRTFCSGLDIIFMDGEEFNLKGSRHNSESADDVELVLNIDGVGREDLLEIWAGPEPFERKIRRFLEQSGETMRTLYKSPPPPGSDHAPYYAKGIPVCMLTFNDQGILHSPEDVYEPSKLNNMALMVRLVIDIMGKLGIIES